MKKFLKWAGIVVGILAVVLFIAFKFLQANTKKASPEMTADYKKDGIEISVFYCSPSKKGREIFGAMIPFGTVWRTGANEATTFTTNKALTIGGKTLPAGKYTLWTIPNKDQWSVIFNSKMYGWGVSLKGIASREADADVLQIDVPVEALSTPQEQFSITFDEATPAMNLAWDRTKIAVPFQ